MSLIATKVCEQQLFHMLLGNYSICSLNIITLLLPTGTNRQQETWNGNLIVMRL